MQSSSSSISSENKLTSRAPGAITTYFCGECRSSGGSNDPVGNRTIRSARTVSPPRRSRSLTAASCELAQRLPSLSIGEVSSGRQHQLGGDVTDYLLIDGLLPSVRGKPTAVLHDQPYTPQIFGNRLGCERPD